MEEPSRWVMASVVEPSLEPRKASGFVVFHVHDHILSYGLDDYHNLSYDLDHLRSLSSDLDSIHDHNLNYDFEPNSALVRNLDFGDCCNMVCRHHLVYALLCCSGIFLQCLTVC